MTTGVAVGVAVPIGVGVGVTPGSGVDVGVGVTPGVGVGPTLQNTAITVPLFAKWPPQFDGESSSSVLMRTSVGISPVIIDPDCVIELAAIAVMMWGMWCGGMALPMGVLVHVPPHSAGRGSVCWANPLKLSGAAPPLNELWSDQLKLQ